MITIDTLNVRLSSRTILDSVTMHLAEGAVHGIVGINGAGKTTLFDTIYGVIRPRSGSVTRRGQRLSRRDVAYLESENFFYDGITGRDMLDLTAHYHPGCDPQPLARLFRLPLDRPVHTWSSGMKKKLALTVALMQRKPVLLLDEPFNGLDIESVHAAQRLILREQAAGRTVVVSSHLFSTLAPVADDIRLLDGGRIVAEYGRADFPRAERELETFFRKRYETFFPEN